MRRFAIIACIAACAACGREPVVQAQASTEGPTASAIPVVVGIVSKVTEEETVPILGTIVAEDRSTVSAEIGGRIAALLVREGDSVHAGQPIARLEAADANLKLGTAEGTLKRELAEAIAAQTIADADLASALAEVSLSERRLKGEAARASAHADEAAARLRLLEKGARPQELERAKADAEASVLIVEAAKQTLAFAERTLQRRKELFQKGFIPERDLDEAQFDHDQASRSVIYAQREQRAKETLLKMLEEGPLPDEIAQARAQNHAAQQAAIMAKSALGDIEHRRQAVRRARAKQTEATSRRKALESKDLASGAAANLAQAKMDAERTLLRAPTSGRVAALRMKVGEAVEVGQAIAEISGANALRLEASAMGSDAASIQQGSLVRVSVKALGGKPLEGTVGRVLAPASDEGTSFRVLVSIPRRPALMAGMVASGEVVVGKLRGALTIPANAIIERSQDGRTSVFRVEGANVKQVDVQVVETAGGRLRVASGLNEGDTVVVEGKELLRDGDLVRIDGGATP